MWEEKIHLIKNTHLFTLHTYSHKLADKQSFLLTLLNIKPVSLIYSNHGEDTPTERALRPDNVQEVKIFLDNLELFYCLKEDENTIEAHISTSKVKLEEFEIAQQQKDIKKIGILLGYPETAVDAFIQNKCLPLDEQDKLLEQKGITGVTVNFRFSKNHYKEEIETYKKWYSELLKYNLLEL